MSLSMLRPPTASAAERWQSCNGSLYAPSAEQERNAAATRGVKIHKYIHDCLQGRESKYRGKVDIAAIKAEIGGDRFFSEQAIQYNTITDRAWFLTGVTDRQYPPMERGDVFGTIDLLIERDMIVVRDWKSGLSVGPAQDNFQLRFLCMAVSRAYCGVEVQPQVGYIREAGSILLDEGEVLGEMDIDAIAADVKRAVLSAPSYAVGDWCGYCGSKGLCELTK